MSLVTDDVSCIVVDPGVIALDHLLDIADPVHDGSLFCCQMFLACDSCDLLYRDREHLDGVSLRDVLSLKDREFEYHGCEKSTEAAEDYHGPLVLFLTWLAVLLFREENNK